MTLSNPILFVEGIVVAAAAPPPPPPAPLLPPEAPKLIKSSASFDCLNLYLTDILAVFLVLE
jgi:hypothetical protein